MRNSQRQRVLAGRGPGRLFQTGEAETSGFLFRALRVTTCVGCDTSYQIEEGIADMLGREGES